MAMIWDISAVCSKLRPLMSCKPMQHAVLVLRDFSRRLPCAKPVHCNYHLIVDLRSICMHAVRYQIFGIWNTFTIMFASSRCCSRESRDQLMGNCILISLVLGWGSN